MKTTTIAVVNQKGGCGKTTVTMQLAGLLGKTYRVLVVDADPQGTAIQWAACADEKRPFPAAMCGLHESGMKLHIEVQKFYGHYDFILIDCPPALDSIIPRSALLIADLVLVPIIPSPTNLWAAQGIQKLIAEMRYNNPAMKAYLLANICQKGVSISNDALAIIADFEIPLLPSKIYKRTAYDQSASFGGTVFDLPNAKPAHEEMLSLKRDILAILDIRDIHDIGDILHG